jgi:hypothetical protein
MCGKYLQTLGAAAASVALVISTTGCEQLPGSDEAQGAAIGGLTGAAAGALIGGEDNRLLGALIGGALGAGGGYIIGANKDRITGNDRDAAQAAATKAGSTPATAEQAMNAETADLNKDGFVTMDEVVAMHNAGLTKEQMIDKLRATGQVFELTAEQRSYLRTHGVSEDVIDAMPEMNTETRDSLLTKRDDVIGQPKAGENPNGDEDQW